jgi:proteasome lid subunit RPN8/RPN11
MLEAEVHEKHPLEACGILFGNIHRQEIIAKRITLTQNVLKSTTRFEIDPKEFYDAFTKAEKEGLAFLGFFHSHPAQASPSSIDLHFMQLWTSAVWLIFSITENKFAAFQLRKNKIHALPLRIERKLKQ